MLATVAVKTRKSLSYTQTHTHNRRPWRYGRSSRILILSLTPSSSPLEQILLRLCLVSRENILESLLFSIPQLVSRPADNVSLIPWRTALLLPRCGGQRFKTSQPIKHSISLSTAWGVNISTQGCYERVYIRNRKCWCARYCFKITCYLFDIRKTKS